MLNLGHQSARTAGQPRRRARSSSARADRLSVSLLASRVVGEAGAVGVGVNEGDELSSGIINLSGAVDVGVLTRARSRPAASKVCRKCPSFALAGIAASAAQCASYSRKHFDGCWISALSNDLSTDCCWVQFRAESVADSCARLARSGLDQFGNRWNARDCLLGIYFLAFTRDGRITQLQNA